MEGEKKGEQEQLVHVYIKLYQRLSIHAHSLPSGPDSAPSMSHCERSAVWLRSVDSVTYECYISESFPPPLHLHNSLSLLSFSLSTSIASSGLYKPPISTASETLALTWLPGGKASPGRDASDHKVPTLICQAAHFKILYFTSGVKKKKTATKKKGRGWCLFLLPLMAINDH